jgi:hypothetical protein
MLYRGDCSHIDVRIYLKLRRWRNVAWSRGTRHLGNVGNFNVVDDPVDIGNVDDLRHARHLGNDGNVRLRLEQHCLVFDTNVDFVDNAGRRCSNRNSDGIHRDRQSGGQLRSRGANYTSDCGNHGIEPGPAHGTSCHTDARRSIDDDGPLPVPELERP